MQFSPTAELMHSLASEYEAFLDAERELSIEEQEQDEEWLERWERDNYEENRLERAEYLVDDDVNHWTNWKNPFRRED